MTKTVYFLFIREKCSTDIKKKKMTQINKAQRGAILQFGKLVNKAKLASNELRRIFTGEAAAEKKLNKLAKQRILQQKSSWRPTQKMRDANLEGKKQAIRDARAMRSAASKAELKWMQENSDKATKVYKSGAREFGGDENKLALLKVRQEAMKPFITNTARSIRNKRLGVLGGIGVLGSSGLIAQTIQPKKKASPQEEIAVKRWLATQGVPEEALKGLTIPEKPVDRLGNLTPECATYVNTQLRGMGINAGGDAYQMGRRYKDFVNGYDGVNLTPNMAGYNHNDSLQAIRNIHYQAADNFKNNLDQLQMRKNHVYPVNMYYKTSPHMIDFYNSAIKENTGTPATHVGYAYWDGKNWRVTHNIHGKIHNELLDEVLGSNNGKKFGITSMRDAGTPRGWEDQ